jgi:carbonic anhydrase
MSFCTAVTCIDGRIHIPVITFLKERYNVDYVDMVSEPGPNRILADATDQPTVESIIRRVKISVEKHQSSTIAVVGHYDCAGNPSTDAEQSEHTAAAVSSIQKEFPDLTVVGLWVDDQWQASTL